MTTHEIGEAHLQRQIDDLKKRVEEMERLLKDVTKQLAAKRLYRG